MKTMVKYIFVVLVTFFFCCGTLSAQVIRIANDSSGIPQDEFEDVMANLKAKIKDFGDALEKLTCVDCGYSSSSKKAVAEDALVLFMGEGDPYLTKMADRYGVVRDIMAKPVEIEFITSKYNQKKTKQPMKRYLTNLANRPQVAKKSVRLDTVAGFRVDNITETGDGKWVAIVSVNVLTEIYNAEDAIKYRDVTHKTIQVFLERIEEETLYGPNRVRWIIKLGDMKAEEIID